MGRLLSKAQTWDDRVDAAKAAWIANGRPPGGQLPGKLPGVSGKVVGLTVGVLVVCLLLPSAGWMPGGLAIWTLPFAAMALAYWGLLAYLAYWVIRTAVEHGVRRALQREALSRAGQPLDS